MGCKIAWTFRARRDLKSIREYIAQDSLYYADILVNHLYERVNVLQD
jgi:plasmid stabilization system protein ParE